MAMFNNQRVGFDDVGDFPISCLSTGGIWSSNSPG
jgi:hypothetical protein